MGYGRRGIDGGVTEKVVPVYCTLRWFSCLELGFCWWCVWGEVVVVFSGEWPGGDSRGVGLVCGDGVDGKVMDGEWAGGESVGVGVDGGGGVDGEGMGEVVVGGV